MPGGLAQPVGLRKAARFGQIPNGGHMNRICKLLFAAAALLAPCGPAAAKLQLVIAETPDHRLVLENRPSDVQTEVTGLINGAPFHDVLACETLTDRLLPVARAEQLSMEAILAQYNLVNLWLGNICPGSSLTAFTPQEARDWLVELAGLRDSEDGSPFLNARDMLVEFYVFGAPGFEADYEAANTALKASGLRQADLYTAYMTERGLGREADLATSLTILESASAGGNRTATALLAQATETGHGRRRDEARAFAMYRELAAGISPPVWYRLGMMHLEGRGTALDPCQARIWLERAAGHAWSPVPAAQTALTRLANQRSCPN